MLKAGIVGLPNVGKSTLFNAVTRTRKAEAANYPFCTIDPNVGIVTVPDERLYVLQKIAKTGVVIPAAVEFVDIVLRITSIREQWIYDKASRTTLHNNLFFRFDW